MEVRGKRQEARGKRQEARGKRQEARGKRQEARGKRGKISFFILTPDWARAPRPYLLTLPLMS
ncbi:MAG: hypothetical protein HEQ20_26665 [Aphanizomenon flos-aquae KM1D3_PB]|nr:MAG: hypothetical protein HEQ20_26665 [Aphanizomenon flos-aquae KM1D3_PB]